MRLGCRLHHIISTAHPLRFPLPHARVRGRGWSISCGQWHRGRHSSTAAPIAVSPPFCRHPPVWGHGACEWCPRQRGCHSDPILPALLWVGLGGGCQGCQLLPRRVGREAAASDRWGAHPCRNKHRRARRRQQGRPSTAGDERCVLPPCSQRGAKLITHPVAIGAALDNRLGRPRLQCKRVCAGVGVRTDLNGSTRWSEDRGIVRLVRQLATDDAWGACEGNRCGRSCCSRWWCWC